MAAFAPVLASESVDLFGHVVASRAFAVGLLFGALAYFAGAVVAVFRRRASDGEGIAFAAAVFLAVRAVYGDRAAPIGLLGGLALLAVGGAMAARARPRLASSWYEGFLRTAAMLVPGAVVLAAAFPVHDPAWVRLAVGVGVVVAGPLVHDFDAAQGAKGAPFMLLALAAIGGYYTVPDPELPLVLLGVALPLALLSVPQPLRKLGPAGSAAAVGAFVWVAAVGGRGRAASVIATVAALGLLLVEPLARRIPRSTAALGKKRRQRSRQSDNWLLVIGVAAVADLAFAAFGAKIVGRTTDTVLAVVMVAPGLVLLGATAPYVLPDLAAARKSRHEPHQSRRSRSITGSRSHRSGHR